MGWRYRYSLQRGRGGGGTRNRGGPSEFIVLKRVSVVEVTVGP